MATTMTVTLAAVTSSPAAAVQAGWRRGDKALSAPRAVLAIRQPCGFPAARATAPVPGCAGNPPAGRGTPALGTGTARGERFICHCCAGLPPAIPAQEDP